MVGSGRGNVTVWRKHGARHAWVRILLVPLAGYGTSDNVFTP